MLPVLKIDKIFTFPRCRHNSEHFCSSMAIASSAVLHLTYSTHFSFIKRAREVTTKQAKHTTGLRILLSWIQH